MDLEHAQQFVRRHHRAVLATRTTTGGIQQSPVLVGLDTAGRFVVSSQERAVKVGNLRRDPWVQLCVLSDDFFGPWIVVEGKVDVLSLPEAMEPLVEYYRAVAGEHGDWEEYREAMRRDRRVLIRVSATRVGPAQES